MNKKAHLVYIKDTYTHAHTFPLTHSHNMHVFPSLSENHITQHMLHNHKTKMSVFLSPLRNDYLGYIAMPKFGQRDKPLPRLTVYLCRAVIEEGPARVVCLAVQLCQGCAVCLLNQRHLRIVFVIPD